MKKATVPTLFTKTLPSLFLSASFALLVASSTTAIADPIAKTAIAKGTLNKVVDRNYPNSKLSKAQIMIAILSANPTAFKGGNINFMLRNRKLSLPTEDMIAAIPEENAAALLVKHNRFYQKGKTGNLTPPTFINTGNKVALDELKLKHSVQSKQVEELSEENTKLQTLVARLEAEKEKRDQDLQILEGKIQALKEAEGEATNTPSGETPLSEQRLINKNEALQQQLVESKSELAENNRTTISLERRLNEVQEQQNQIAADNTEQTPQENAVDPMSEMAQAPATDLNGNIVSPEEKQSSGFNISKLTWLLPLLAIFVGLGLLFKRFFGGKKHSDLNLDEIDDYDFTTPKMSTEDRNDDYLATENNEVPVEAPLEVSIKLDVARAYMEAEDNQSAYEMLHEVLQEGNADQQDEANQLLAKL